MYQIMAFLSWNDFITLTRMNPIMASYKGAMSGSTLYMGRGFPFDELALDYLNVVKSVEIDYAVPEHELQDLMGHVEAGTSIEKLVIRNPPNPIDHITSVVIRDLTIETTVEQNEWEAIDHLEPLLQTSQQIRALTCINNYLGKESLRHLLLNPLTKLILIDTEIMDQEYLQNYLTLAVHLRHVTILGDGTYRLQDTFFGTAHSCGERLTSLEIELLTGFSTDPYANIPDFVNLKKI